METDHEPSPQELLQGLKARRERVGEKMRTLPEGSKPGAFARLYKKAEELDVKIRQMQSGIKPGSPSGEVSQFTLESSRDPSGRRTIRKQ